MSVLKILILCFASLGVLSFQTYNTPANAAETRCLKSVKGPWARGLFKRTVKKRAILRWNVSVRIRRGWRFAKWADATSRRMPCKKKGRRWHCRAIGQPCGVVP